MGPKGLPLFRALVVLLVLVGFAPQERSNVPIQASNITGRVVGAPDEAELWVSCWVEAQRVMLRFRCADDGSFVIDGLAPNLAPVVLRAMMKHGPLATFRSWTNDDGLERISPSVSARPGTSGVLLTVPPPSLYRFRVAEADTAEPLSGARIGRLDLIDSELPLPAGSLTEAGGVYTLSVFQPERCAECALAVSYDGHERVAVGELPFAPGEPQDLGSVALRRLAPTLLRITSVTDDRPVEAARVEATLVTSDCGNAHMVSHWPARRSLPDGWSGTTSAAGTTTAYLSPGETYWIRVEHPEHALFWRQVVTEPNAPERLDLVLGSGGAVTVSCIEVVTKRPLASERIAYEPTDSHERQEVRTGVDGRVTIEHLVPGRYCFWLEGHDRRHSQFVDVVDGASFEVTLSVDP